MQPRSEYGAMLEGLVRLQAAGMMTAAAVAARGGRLTVRHGEAMFANLVWLLGRPDALRHDLWSDLLKGARDAHTDYLRAVLGLPRIAAMVFISELHGLRREAMDMGDEPPAA